METKTRRYKRNYTNTKNILEICSKYLKPKGKLIYSTCSIFSEENDKIIDKFLEQNQDYINDKIEVNNTSEKLEKIQLYQNEETDGFFICKLQKK